MAVTGPTKVATWEGDTEDSISARHLLLKEPGAHSPCFQERARLSQDRSSRARMAHPWGEAGWSPAQGGGRAAAQKAQLDPAEGMGAEKHGGPEKQGQRDTSVAMRVPVGQEAHA